MDEKFKKPYDPAATEPRIYEAWEKSGYFNPDNLKDGAKKQPYAIMMPPPNATGVLHMGHARTFWIAAQRASEHHGQLIFRNEDLDSQRCRPEFVEAMFEDLRWLGIDWREGPDCGADLTKPGTRIEYDHDQACKDGGDNSFENCRVLCKHCHNAKTFGPDAEKFQTIRKREKRTAGIKPKSSRPMPGSKASGLRKRMNGRVERRNH